MRHFLFRPFVLTLALVGCAPGSAVDGSGGSGTTSATGYASSAVGSPATSGAGGADPCPSCVSTSDCATGSFCAQLANDAYCAPLCGANDACSPGRTCVIVTTSEGQQKSVCVPTSGACADGGGATTSASTGSAGGNETCGTFVGPNVTATCSSCSGGSCQANGCYGGWWCDTATSKCHAPPANCGGSGSGGAGGGSSGSGGGPVTGTVDGNGGTVSSLLFTVVGDTRPAVINDTAGYPSAIINKIYADIEALNPRPVFSVSTGDYVFATASGSLAAGQFDLYLAARQKFTGTFFPAMGNHECTGATASNCGAGSTDGITNNYTQFLSKLLGPIGKSAPYYALHINAIDGTWTSKFVFVAANAWSSAQASWLDSTLAQATTYTFVMRHESNTVTQAPGVSPSNQIIAQHPYTLEIVGHTHTYGHSSGREIIIGNGGAPLTGSGNYGFGLLKQRSDGAIVVDMIDYQSGASDPSFHFAVHPDGSPAAP